MKMINNQMRYYERNWPFEQPKDGFIGSVFSMFWNFKIVRWFIGGEWVKGEEFGIWLKINKHFPDEWKPKYEYEDWR